MRKILTIVLIIVATIGFVTASFFIWKNLFPHNEFADSYDEAIFILNENYPSEILVYGNDVGFREAVKYRAIEALSEEDFNLNTSSYKYHFLVINDINNDLSISKEDFIRCKKYADENKLNFYYIGKQYLDLLRELQFYGMGGNEENRGIAYVISPIGRDSYVGIWTTDDETYLEIRPEILGELLAFSFVDDVIKKMS